MKNGPFLSISVLRGGTDPSLPCMGGPHASKTRTRREDPPYELASKIKVQMELC